MAYVYTESIQIEEGKKYIDLPLDERTRIKSLSDLDGIQVPYIGMIVYIIDQD